MGQHLCGMAMETRALGVALQHCAVGEDLAWGMPPPCGLSAGEWKNSNTKFPAHRKWLQNRHGWQSHHWRPAPSSAVRPSGNCATRPGWEQLHSAARLSPTLALWPSWVATLYLAHSHDAPRTLTSRQCFQQHRRAAPSAGPPSNSASAHRSF